MTHDPINIVVLISGSGSNLQAIMDRCLNGDTPARIGAVISNKADAYGLERARRAGVPVQVIDHREYDGREDFDQALINAIDAHGVDLVVLAGFMRILTERFTSHYHGRLLNIHPSLLPKYKGLHTHRRALEAGDSEHGASVHFVTADLDGGPVILQGRIAIEDGDTETTLAERLLGREHQIYPTVVDWFARGRLYMDGRQAWLDDEPLLTPIDFDQL